MTDLWGVPPEVIMGEAGICSFLAMVAVAYVYQRNPQMNGWHDCPNDRARLAAGLWWLFQDPSRGARFVFSVDDLRLKGVREIVQGVGPPRARFRCAVGGLVFY